MDHSYFQILQRDLKQYGQGVPQLIVDKVQVMHNLSLIKPLFKDQIYPRIVVKSLANISLLRCICNTLNTDRFMVFHLPQLFEILKEFPDADILLGKPMPIKAAQHFYQHYPQYQKANIQWLVDDIQRLEQYLALAKQLNLKIKINVEIDVGLHRGGVQSDTVFLAILKILEQHQHVLIFSGLMGYDAHVAKLPKWLKKVEKAYQESQEIYKKYKELIVIKYPQLWHENLCFNGGGSPTLMLHTQKSVCNDVAFGSVILKPSDFNQESLKQFKPALWIASPVLKVLSQAEIPALEVLNHLPLQRQAVFIYGGYWLANYVYPQDVKINLLYGRSTNQELIMLANSTSIQVDDYIFAQPTQSEQIIPQFRALSWYEKNQFFETENFRE